MYSLECGDKKIKDMVRVKVNQQDRVREIIEMATSEDIIDSILSGDSSQKDSKTILIALAYSDKIEKPMPKNIADIMFFTYCVNYFRTDLSKKDRIDSLYKAKMMYSAYNNDYQKYEVHNIKKEQRYTSLKWGDILAFGQKIEFRIPVSFFKGSNGKNYVCLSADTPMVMVLNNENEFKIPRKAYIKLFITKDPKHRIVAENTEGIKEMFNVRDIDGIKKLLVMAGCEKIASISQDMMPKTGMLIFENEKLILKNCSALDLVESEYLRSNGWEYIEGAEEYILLPKINYLLLGDYERGEVKVLGYRLFE